MKSPIAVSRAHARVSRPTQRQLDMYMGVLWIAAFIGVILMVMLLASPSQV